MGLVDYSDDGSSTPSSPEAINPKDSFVTKNQTNSTLGNDSIENDNLSEKKLDSAQLTNVISKASIEEQKAPGNFDQMNSISSPLLKPSPKTSVDKNQEDGSTLIPLDAPVENLVPTKLTPEEIRTKRLQLLMPEAWRGCSSWELPPEPSTEVDDGVQAKVVGLQSMLERGIQFNERLQANQSFRNPHIYDKLVEYLDLDEFGTNFPNSWYDPKAFPASIKGSRLSDAQRAAAKAKAAAQAANTRTSISFIPSQAPSDIASSAIKRVMSSVDSSTLAAQHSDSRRRKTKWDMPPSAS